MECLQDSFVPISSELALSLKWLMTVVHGFGLILLQKLYRSTQGSSIIFECKLRSRKRSGENRLVLGSIGSQISTRRLLAEVRRGFL